MNKQIYLFIGILALIIGTIGMILPVIPTTPLLMLSCYAFSKSSEKFHRWLINSHIYHKYAKDFIENRTMPLKRKIILLTFASTMLLFPLFILHPILKLLIIACYIYLYYFFIFQIKTL